MLKRLLVIPVLLCISAMAMAEPPRLVRSEPAGGATGVPVDVGLLRCHFDRNMKQNTWSLMMSDKGEFPHLDGKSRAMGRCNLLRTAPVDIETGHDLRDPVELH